MLMCRTEDIGYMPFKVTAKYISPLQQYLVRSPRCTSSEFSQHSIINARVITLSLSLSRVASSGIGRRTKAGPFGLPRKSTPEVCFPIKKRHMKYIWLPRFCFSYQLHRTARIPKFPKLRKSLSNDKAQNYVTRDCGGENMIRNA